jgi:hypothetical protein
VSTRVQMWCMWCGPAGILLWLIGFVFVGGLMPPPKPSWTGEQVQAFYQSNTNGIRAGLLITLLGATLTAPWVAAISTQMKRIEGRYSPLAYTQLGLGMLGILLFVFPVMTMQTVAFRPDRDPSQMLLLNDLAWLPFVGVWMLAALQNVAIGVAAFMDKEQQVFPRWVGYFNIWTAVLFCPGSLLYFFKEGPFAWNGALSWWFVVVVFVAWFAVMLYAMRRAIQSQAHEAEPVREPVLQ